MIFFYRPYKQVLFLLYIDKALSPL